MGHHHPPPLPRNHISLTCFFLDQRRNIWVTIVKSKKVYLFHQFYIEIKLEIKVLQGNFWNFTKLKWEKLGVWSVLNSKMQISVKTSSFLITKYLVRAQPIWFKFLVVPLIFLVSLSFVCFRSLLIQTVISSLINYL